LLTTEQKETVQAVIGVFETGKAGGGDPSTVALLRDHAGVTYGINQTTDVSGGLDEIVLEYADRGGRYARDLLPYVDRLSRNESARTPAPLWVDDLCDLLRRAGRDDPLMLAAQRAVFDRRYWAPCAGICEAAGLVLPLSWAAVYDSIIHSNPAVVSSIRSRFRELPPARGGVETDWTVAYIHGRRTWLERFVGRDEAHTLLVRSTIYRPKALLALANAGRWSLDPPVPVALPRGTVQVS
jgi:hypothetical protein